MENLAYTRLCAVCNSVRRFSSKRAYELSIKNNRNLCRSCGLREAWSHRRSDGIKMVDEMLLDQKHSVKEIHELTGISEPGIRDRKQKLGLVKKWPTAKVIDERYAECSTCQQILPHEDFEAKNPYGKRVLMPSCRECTRLKQKQYAKEHRSKQKESIEGCFAERARSLKQDAKLKGVLFDVSGEYLRHVYDTQLGRCLFSNVYLPWKIGETNNREEMLSIDKVIPERGYIEGNIVILSYRINTIKSDVTLEEMRLWMPTWYERLMQFPLFHA